MLNFLNQKGYYQGVIFLLLMMVVSCANDVIAKYIGQRLDPIEVIFFRFFFGFVTLLPFAISRGFSSFKTRHMTTNIMRGVLGVVSFYLYNSALVHLQIVEVVTVLWTIPLFVLILSVIFLGEAVSATRWIATAIGFVGLAFITMYDSGVSFSFKLIYLIPAAAAFLFAVQDVMIKKLVDDDSKVTMLLYFSLVTTVLSLIPAIFVWKNPTLFELSMLFIYGAFANLMQYFIFRAFAATDLSALAPYRYLEFLFSAVAGFIFFAELPGLNVIMGAIILVPCTLYLGYSENKKSKKEIELQEAA
ncbi:MAG: DMT family transporter [Alphaproteobacteria bacterium]|nr:DMT family transporter [Alphaproteobacteria bacterium]